GRSAPGLALRDGARRPRRTTLRRGAGRQPRAHRPGDHHLLRLSSAGGVAGGDGDGEARLLRHRRLLGTAPPRVRRPGGPPAGGGPGPRRARWQPHRARLHRRPQRRLALPGHAPRRLREPVHQRGAGRRADAHGGVGQRSRPLRPSRQQADAGRARHLPPVPPPRAAPAHVGPCRRRARCLRLAGGGRSARRATSTPLRAPGRAPPPGGPDAAGLVPPEPAEHLHGDVDRGHARRRLHPGAGAGCL
ncbi:MAG: Uracil-DNA glycosylase, family 5, partial [uncultured Acidimicrobiales bacterium]